MKFDKKPIGVVLVVSGLAAAGFQLAPPTGSTGLLAPPAPKAGSQLTSNGALSPVLRTAPPGAAGTTHSAQINTSPSLPTRSRVAGHPTTLPARAMGTAVDPGFADRPISDGSADSAPSGVHPITARSGEQNGTSAATETTPAFRAMTGVGASPSVSDALPVKADPVVLEFAEHQQLPAVLVAGEASANTDLRQASTAAMAATIAREFVATVTDSSTPAASPAPAPAEAAGIATTPTDSSLGAPPAETAPASSNPITPEQRWDTAANLADEQYRLLIGQDEYQRKAIQAAILKQQQAAAIP